METTPPKYEPAGSKPRISIDYVIGAFLDSVERFPITMCWLMVFIVWGVVDCWSYNLFNGAPTAVQNLQPALWFLTVNGMMLTLAVYLWCEQTDSRRLCGKIQIAANLLLLADLVNMILNYNSFSDSVWVGRLAVETALAVAIIFVPALKTTSHRHRLMFSYMQSGNVILAVVIAGLMAIAVSIIYGTIMLLFGDVSGELWVSSLIIFSAGLGILVFLGSIPTYEQASKMAKDYEPVKFQMAMIKYILLPLTAIYTLILYVYGLKIIATGVMPKGEICFMVTALTAAVYLLLFLLKAIDSSTGREDRLTRLSLRFFECRHRTKNRTVRNDRTATLRAYIQYLGIYYRDISFHNAVTQHQCRCRIVCGRIPADIHHPRTKLYLAGTALYAVSGYRCTRSDGSRTLATTTLPP